MPRDQIRLKTYFTKNWLERHLRQVRSRAGNRYTPELNVDLPISDIFEGMSRSSVFYDSLRKSFGKLSREFHGISGKYEGKQLSKLYRVFREEVLSLLRLLSTVREFDTKSIPWKHISRRAKRSLSLSWKLATKLREEKDRNKDKPQPQPTSSGASRITPSERLGYDLHHLIQTQHELRHFEELCSSTKARLSNNPFLILTGSAGTGKTHLLCDVIKNRLGRTQVLPAALVFGEFFNDGTDIWRQIANQLCLPRKLWKRRQLLRALDLAGKQAGARSLLMIDALNETRPPRYWKKHLKILYTGVKRYPHIALTVSIRSGFEDATITEQSRKTFISEEHRGFQFREWEAVVKFFHEFHLPLPEIPLLMPEFQNPLFLLLFCKAFQARSTQYPSKQRERFRGHEGATYIFERFVKNVADGIASRLGLSKGKTGGAYVIWDTVIEKVAEEMVKQDSDRIPEAMVMEIVKAAHPSINHGNLVKELERNMLLTKVPRYARNLEAVKGFDYRFPFQKFSDHLLGRYIFKQFRSSGRTPRQYFARNTRIGKLLTHSQGLVEALSVQCPEQLDGRELIEIAPHLINSYFVIEAFVDSLIWRKPTAFTPDLRNTLNFINRYVIRTEAGHRDLLNAFLSIAPIPEHPFNAYFLHKHLWKYPMPARDAWWSTFLHRQYGEKGAVDRLIEWGWSRQDRSHIRDDSLKLCAIALAWFLTTPNRFLRDKATKALVSLLSDRLGIVLELLRGFRKVDDPYVSERLYAVVYGCALRNSKDSRNLKKLARWIYKDIFTKKRPIPHILIRDYARGVIEVALHRKLIKVDPRRIRPPYRSTWPTSVPSVATLKKRYYPEEFLKRESNDRGYLEIWSSVMYGFGTLGDFGRYILESNVSHWSGIRLNSKQVNREKLFTRFQTRLTRKQKKLLNEAYSSAAASIILIRYYRSDSSKDQPDEATRKKQESEAREQRRTALKKFKLSLSSGKRRYFEKELLPYLDEWGRVNDPLREFDSKLAQRWLFKRVVDLGWDPKRHGEFDHLVNYHRVDRTEHKPERIGKKYQWIALYELLARIADNFRFKEESWSHSVVEYVGPWQISVRNIDPSCLLHEGPYDQWEGLPSFKKHARKLQYNAWSKNVSDLAWLRSVRELPKPANLVELIDDRNHAWLALEGFMEWQEPTPPEGERYNLPTRRLWYMLKSYLVKQQHKNPVFEWAKAQNFMGRWMPESHEFYEVFLGEYPWAPAFLHHYIPYYHHDGWTNGGSRGRIPEKILVTDDKYLSRGSSIDCSTDEAIRVQLPAKWLVDQMRLTQKETDGRFFDKRGNLVVLDPTLFNKEAPKMLLIRKDKLCDFLKRKGYSIFWTLLGKKNVIGGPYSGQRWIGRLELRGAYTVDQKGQVHGMVRPTFRI